MTQDDIIAILGLPHPLPCFSFDSVTEDSRRVKKDSLFIALQGEQQDGHDFAAAAAAAGATAILGNRPATTELNALPYIYYESPRRAAGLLAHGLYGNPSEQQCVIGVTGTNGKTTVSFLTQHILKTAGRACANFGTLGYDLGKTQEDAPHTTPFGESLAALFAEALNQGSDHVVMEVSSHALAQERVAGISFNVAAFTNLTQDHLDFHKDMESYLQAKRMLFESVNKTLQKGKGSSPCFGVINVDDPHAAEFEASLPDHCRSYGAQGMIKAEERLLSDMGATFKVVTPWGDHVIHSRMLGTHNVLNALCAIGITTGLSLSLDEIASGIETFPGVPGRFEAVDAGQPFQIIVDYAHTDDGLRNALSAARAICKGRLIVVFGCGGDRDKGKRPKMGSVAAELADYVVLTSDNPRTEDPYRILLDVEMGLQRKGKSKHDHYAVIESRREAIAFAVHMAQPADLILIAGKGHETYQIIGTERRHFDDREEARRAVLEHVT